MGGLQIDFKPALKHVPIINTLAYLAPLSMMKRKKSFITLTPVVFISYTKSLVLEENNLECSLLKSFSIVQYFAFRSHPTQLENLSMLHFVQYTDCKY